ncbi:SF1B family DNA helicase RecD2 [Erythrobacter aureus]|nr:ATP-dependent RecD-like DNA helicase [Erythrobacter aureus]
MTAQAQGLPLPLNTGHEASLEGRVTRMIFDAPDGKMRVFQIQLDDASQMTVRQYDNLQPLKKDDQIKAIGKVVEHKRFGRQFQARDVLRRIPSSPEGVAKVLAGKEFKGIGPKMAQRLADSLGSGVISILNQGDPDGLVAGLIGESKANSLLASWASNMQEHAAHATLADLGVGPHIRKKIIETIPDFEAVLQTEPYRIAKEVDGVGFGTADELAKRAGTYQIDSPQRLEMGIQHALDLAALDGHTGLSYTQLLDKACEVLTFGDRKAVTAVLDREIEEGSLLESPNKLIQKPSLARLETRLARFITRLARSTPPPLNPVSVTSALKSLKKDYGVSDEQFGAVSAALKNSLSVLTGGPGTGKTFTIKAIIETFKKLMAERGQQPRVLLMAPTGLAADRMQDSTGYEASTMHMALQFDPETHGFVHNDQNPFPYDLIVADEFSMSDTRMADAVIRAVAGGKTRLIIVGDPDQLPSVDAGRVLHDLILSGICEVTKLTIVRRTGEGSAIALGAERIKNGKLPEFGQPGKSDLVFIEMDDPQAASDRIIEMVSDKIPTNIGHPTEKIQVLSPGKNSTVGVLALNVALQNALNPVEPIKVAGNDNDRVIIRNGHHARMGDRIMCMKTNYNLNIYNGDAGVITDIEVDPERNAFLHNNFGKKDVALERAYWANLDLAYALTVHKSQGSEYDVVVIPMTTSHWVMLKRNLLYTAVTRAKKLCVIVGSKRALQRAIETLDGTSRQTGLLSRIKAAA